jgi:hypothetical protein
MLHSNKIGFYAILGQPKIANILKKIIEAGRDAGSIHYRKTAVELSTVDIIFPCSSPRGQSSFPPVLPKKNSEYFQTVRRDAYN